MGDGVGFGGGVGCVGDGVVVRAGLLKGWGGGFNSSIDFGCGGGCGCEGMGCSS